MGGSFTLNRFSILRDGGNHLQNGRAFILRVLLRFASDVICRTQDCDAAERIQVEEILVACHNHICAPVYGRFEELIALWITRRSDRARLHAVSE